MLSFESALGFVLNGVNYSNGSTVLRTDIGVGDAALQCTTDSTTCCTLRMVKHVLGTSTFLMAVRHLQWEVHHLIPTTEVDPLG